jgi:hypothetical protein
MGDTKIQQLISITVDPDFFDLDEYTADAVADGFADDPENGVWYLAQAIADDYSTFGCRLEVIP